MSSHPFEQLGPEEFQNLVQALLLDEYPDLQCFPVAQPDGGRDGLAGRLGESTTVLQVKFTRQPERVGDVADSTIRQLKGEVEKVDALAKIGVSRYIFATNLAASAHLDAGSIDRVQTWLNDHYPIPSQVLWQADLDRRVEAKPGIRWDYPALLRAADVLSDLEEHSTRADDRSLRMFLRAQHDRDSEVRFKQIDLQRDLLNLYVDLPIQPKPSSKLRMDSAVSSLWSEVVGQDSPYMLDWDVDRWLVHGRRQPPGSADLLLHPRTAALLQCVVLEGAPGQGKSTLAQYLCQVHRIKLLNEAKSLSRLPEEHAAAPIMIPFKIELRLFAPWLRAAHSGESANPSLDGYIAELVTEAAGGATYSVESLHSLVERQPVFLVLDGLDEVADVEDRRLVVQAIADASSRLRSISPGRSPLLVVTSRPAAFANSPGLPAEKFHYLELGDLSTALALDYASRWASAKSLSEPETSELLGVVKERLGSAHLADLAKNVMQLSILLFLLRTKGASLPDKRTALYRRYVEVFFDREAEKTTWVRDYRSELEDLHRSLAWRLQLDAEAGGAGLIDDEDLRGCIAQYLDERQSDASIENIFSGVVERLVMLVSRVEGRFEFEVQPLREYFCASYLYEEAPYSPVGEESVATKPERFATLAANSYWLNVTRFYAGFYSKGELAGLAVGLQELAEDNQARACGYVRELCWVLLADWVFSQDPKSRDLVTDIVLDGFGSEHVIMNGEPPEIADISVRERVFSRSLDLLSSRGLKDRRARVAKRGSAVAQGQDWAVERWKTTAGAADGPQRTSVIAAGGPLGVLRACPVEDLASLIEPEAEEAALQAAICVLGGADDLAYLSDEYAELVLTGLSSTPLAAQPGRAQTPLSRVLWFIDAVQRTMPRKGITNSVSLVDRIELSWRPRDPATGSMGGLESVPASLSGFGPVANQLWELTTRPMSDWTDDAELWREVDSLYRSVFPANSSIVRTVALTGSVAGQQGAAGVELSDESVDLLTRLRAARRNQGKRWWLRAFDGASSSKAQACAVALCFAWGRGPLLAKLQERLERELQDLKNDDFDTITHLVARVSWRDRASSGLRPSRVKWSAPPSHRFLTLLYPRSQLSDQAWLYDRGLNEYTGRSRSIRATAYRAGLAWVMEGSGSVEELLPVARRASGASRAVTGRQPIGMSEKTARAVLRTPERYPIDLVLRAEDVSGRLFRSSVAPVGAIADAEGWA